MNTPPDLPAATIPPPTTETLRPLPFLTLVMMAGACAATVANVYYNQPLLSDFAVYFRTSIDHAGSVATATQVGYGTGLLFFIPLGDVLERRTVVLCLAYSCAALLVAAALSTSLWMLIATQLLVGLTAVSAQLLIPLAVDLSPSADRGRTVGLLMTGVLCGILLARTLGGFIGDHFGWRAMFWLASGAMLLTGVMLQAMLPHRKPTLQISYARLMHSLWGLFRDQPVVRNVSLVSAASFAAFCAFWAVLSFLMRDRFHLGATEAGLFGIVGLVGALCAPYAGKLSDRRGPAFTLTIAMVISVLSFVQMWLWASIVGLVVGVLVLDLGVQSAQVAAQTEVMTLLPEARNRLNTIYMVLRYVGGAAGSTIGTLAYARTGWNGTCVACILVLVAGTAIHLFGRRPPSDPQVGAAVDLN